MEVQGPFGMSRSEAQGVERSSLFEDWSGVEDERFRQEVQGGKFRGWKFRAGRFKVGFRVGFEIPSRFGLKIPQVGSGCKLRFGVEVRGRKFGVGSWKFLGNSGWVIVLGPRWEIQKLGISRCQV